MDAFVRLAVVAFGTAALLAAPARAEMVGGLPVGEVAPDETVTPAGGEPALLSAIQGQRVMLLVAFKST
jgi:hypothetical protein